MDLLGLVILIAISIISSVKKSNDAKQQRAKRQQASQSTVYRSQSGSVPSAERKTATGKTSSSADEVLDGLSDFFRQFVQYVGHGAAGC